MVRWLLLIVAVGLFTGCGPGTSRDDAPQKRVGCVIIRGNQVTPDRFIREHFPLYPGQSFSWSASLRAEMTLALAGLDAAIIVREDEGGGRFHDIEIWVRETPLQYLVFGGRHGLLAP
jgi:hypothetical protein